ncbi:MAG: hypothetical protein ACRYHQ_22800 [Janthinobacterium lividum]
MTTDDAARVEALLAVLDAAVAVVPAALAAEAADATLVVKVPICVVCPATVLPTEDASAEADPAAEAADAACVVADPEAEVAAAVWVVSVWIVLV